MQCRYCRGWNEEDERRCVGCGRRLQISTHQPYAFSTATAPDLARLARQEPEVSPRSENVGHQTSLFRDASRGLKVVPIPTLVPAHTWRETPAPRRAPTRVPRAAPRPVQDLQQSLDFQNSYAEAAPQRAQVEAVIYCDAPVALPAHRIIATAFDISMVLIGAGLFLAIFFLAGGDLVLSKQNVPFLFCVASMLALFYRALWCLAGGDTPGMRFAGLKLVDFDGRSPDREQRGLRQMASLLSVLSAGLGLVWALVDEESLTWHDHISKTFPTIAE